MAEKIFFSIPKNVINLHCHGRGFKQRHRATILQLLTEAKKGLVSILAFMPNTIPPIADIPMLSACLNLVKRARKKLSISREQKVWFGVTDDNLSACEQALEFDEVIGLKIYPLAADGKPVTTGTIGVKYDKTIKRAMELARTAGKAVAVHCDDPAIIARFGNTIEAEVSYVKKILSWAREVEGVKIVIVHVSCKKSADLILAAQAEGIKVMLELCSHYLWFDNEGTNWNPALDSAFYHCFNNLRGAKDREYLVSLLKTDNLLLMVSTDDAWHTAEEKLSAKRPRGLPSIREMVPLMVTLAVENGISAERVAQLISYNASDFFNIPVSKELVNYEWERKADDILYNGGTVTNPWNGSKLFFPV